MEGKRAKTYAYFSALLSSAVEPCRSYHFSLEALSAFIQSQKALLDRTQHDITRLQELRQNVVSNPDDTLDIFSQQVRTSILEWASNLKVEQVSSIAVPLSAQPAILESGAQGIEWGIFEGYGTFAPSFARSVSESRRPISAKGTYDHTSIGTRRP